MTAAARLRTLAARGFQFEVDGERLHVAPAPDAKTIAVLRKQKAELLALVVEHGGRWPPPERPSVFRGVDVLAEAAAIVGVARERGRETT